MAFLIEVVVDRRMDGREFLQTSHLSEALHGPFSSSKQQMGILHSVIQPTTRFLLVCDTNLFKRSAERCHPVRHNNFRTAILTHCFLKEFQGSFLIAHLCDVAVQNLTFMIDGPPKIVFLAVDLHEHLVKMPAPVGV